MILVLLVNRGGQTSAYGDLGPSMSFYDYDVTQLLMIGLPFTLMLGFTAFTLATAIGIVAGIFAALYHNKWPDTVLVLAVMLGVIVPNFLMGALLLSDELADLKMRHAARHDGTGGSR